MRRHSERGSASVEWTALVLVVSIAFAGFLAVAPSIDGRSFGGFLAHTITCTIRGDCPEAGDPELVAAYGTSDAELVRRYAPNLAYEPGERSLPIDWRDCRVRACSRAPDKAGLDAHISDAGNRATAFTHVVRSGGETFIQYWFYYPYSNTTIGNTREGIGATKIPLDGIESAAGNLTKLLGLPVAARSPWSLTDKVMNMAKPKSDDGPYKLAQLPKLWSHMPFTVRALAWQFSDGKTGSPLFHRDDWEGYQVRIDAAGRATSRATSHGHYQWCSSANCSDDWGPETGWSRVSFGSHAGHIPARLRIRAPALPVRPGLAPGERSTTSSGLRLVPLETVDRDAYTRRDAGIVPPWEKDVYENPLSNKS